VFPKLLHFDGYFLPAYGVLVAAGFFAGLWITGKLARRRGLDPERISNIAVMSALAGLIGAKLLMFLVDFQYFWNNPGEIFTFGTLQAAGVFYGGLIGAIAVGWHLFRKYSLPPLATLDVYAPGLALGQGIGRLGCLAAGCCWGDRCERPWAVRFTRQDAFEVSGVPLGVDLHPSQIYEAAANFIVFFVTWKLWQRERPGGMIFGIYLVLSSAARLGTEFFRYHQQPNPFGLWLTSAQWMSIGLMLFGFWAIRQRRAE